uniref:Restriction endonuclease n=1 Tax=Geobacter sp. (strain M21) TaxID=443144 RepID=C6E1F4_GEOSM
MLAQYIADGNRCMRQSDYGAAVRHLEKAVALDPRSLEALMNLSVAYRKMCEYEKSIDAIKKAITLNEEQYALYEILATTCMSTENYCEAASAFEKALQGDYDPREASVLHARLAVCYQNSGDSNSTRTALKRSLQLHRSTLHELYSYRFTDFGWPPAIQQLEQEIDTEAETKAKVLVVSFMDTVNNQVDRFNEGKPNQNLLNNFISKYQPRLFLNIHNLNMIEEHLLRKHYKLPQFFLTPGITVGSISGEPDYDMVADFLDSDFYLLAKLVSKRVDIQDVSLADHVTYKIMIDAIYSHFTRESKSEFDSYLNGISDTRHCVELLLKQGNYDLTSSAYVGLLTYYIMDMGGFDEILGLDSGHNYVKCYIALLDIIEEIQEEKSVDDFEAFLQRDSKLDYVGIHDVDLMDGNEFEIVVGMIFEKTGYKVVYTKASGDQGVDVIAEKHGRKFGIQAKCYSKAVPNSAVQEVVAGAKYYSCDRGIVVTNNYFTKSAKELADSNEVILWDREFLAQKLTELNLTI